MIIVFIIGIIIGLTLAFGAYNIIMIVFFDDNLTKIQKCLVTICFTLVIIILLIFELNEVVKYIV